MCDSETGRDPLHHPQLEPEEVALHLKPWLQEHFGPNISLTVIVEDKLSVLGAFGVVDDRPETIARVCRGRVVGCHLIQP